MPITINGSTGIAGVDGSASTPAIQGTDTNTGIYFPGADRVGITEGGTQVGEFDASGNFKFNSGYGSVATAYGCRAWVNFNGTGTPAVLASGNVSSITDLGVGNYEVNLTTAMPDTNFACVTSPSIYAGVTDGAWVRAAPFSTTKINVYCFYKTDTTGASVAVFDPTYVQVAAFR